MDNRADSAGTFRTASAGSRLTVALLTLVVLVTAGCGGKGKARTDTSASESSLPVVSSAPTTQGPPAAAERTINKTGWFGGFAITVGKVSVKPDGNDRAKLVMSVTYENLGTEQSTPPGGTYAHLDIQGHTVGLEFLVAPLAGGQKSSTTANAEIDLREVATAAPTSSAPGGSGGSTSNPYDFLTKIRSVYPTASPGASTVPTVPTVPGDETTTASVPVVTDLSKLLDQSVLVYGEPTDNQTKIPFAASAKVSSYAPKTLPLGVTLGTRTVVNLVRATVRPSYQLNDKGKYEFTLYFGATCSDKKACGKYGFSLAHDNFVLTLPDGTKVEPDFRSQWCCSPVAPDQPLNDPKTSILFVIPGPPSGSVVITYNEPKKTPVGYSISLG